MLTATIISKDGTDRLFINDVEFPWPTRPLIDGWDLGDGKSVVCVEILVDEISWREAPSD